MAAYGVPDVDTLFATWTLGRLFVQSEAIRRRRYREQAELATVVYMAAGAAQGGKGGYSALKQYQTGLLRQAGIRKHTNVAAIAAAMGLKVRGNPPPGD